MSQRQSFRCSQLPQVLACSGAPTLIARMKPQAEFDPAARNIGHWGHYEAATTLMDDHGAVFTGPSERPPAPDLPKDFEVSDFDRWKVRYYVETINYYTPADYAIEVEAEFAHAFEHFDLTGHGDCFAINAEATEAIGFDFKSGSDYVDEAENNAQVTGYIVLMRKAYPTLKRITYVIVQPANSPDDGHERVSRVCVEGADLDGLELYLERELNKACQEPLELNSDGWKQCRYCPAVLVCPCIKADLDHMKLKLTQELLDTCRDDPGVDQLLEFFLAGRKFGKIFEMAGGILKYRVMNHPNRVIQVGEHKLTIVSRAHARTIHDNQAATAALADLPDALFHRTYKFKPGEIEEVLAEHLSKVTGAKVPVASKKKGPDGKPILTGESEYETRLGKFTEQGMIHFIKVS